MERLFSVEGEEGVGQLHRPRGSMEKRLVRLCVDKKSGFGECSRDREDPQKKAVRPQPEGRDRTQGVATQSAATKTREHGVQCKQRQPVQNANDKERKRRKGRSARSWSEI
jgi:hypothetical protein